MRPSRVRSLGAAQSIQPSALNKVECCPCPVCKESRMTLPSKNPSEPASGPLILLTGATCYIGGRLLPRFEELGLSVRCLTRRPADLEHRLGPNSTAVKADMLDDVGLADAMRGGDTAFYLVHSM